MGHCEVCKKPVNGPEGAKLYHMVCLMRVTAHLRDPVKNALWKGRNG